MARPITTICYQGASTQADPNPGVLHLTTSGPDRVVRLTRIEVMRQATYDALAEKSNATLYIINPTATPGRGTAHRWPLAADTASATFLGETLVTAISGPT